MSPETIVSVISTDIKEASEFVEAYFGNAILFIIAIVVLFTIVNVWQGIILLHNNIFSVSKKLSMFIFVCMLIAVSCLMPKIQFIRNFTTALKMKNTMSNFTKYSKVRLAKIEKNCDGFVHSQQKVANFALIIGESHTRSKMHAYGYFRETTPFLDNNIKNGNTVLINNAYSSSALTHIAVPAAISQNSQYNGINLYAATNLVEMAQHAGYKVVWITNQVSSTMPLVNGIIKESNKIYTLNTTYDDANLRKQGSSLDDKVVECLAKEVLSDEKTLYIIHLLGSHSVYKYRYPANFNRWENDNDYKDDTGNSVNNYDNSVLYNDVVLENISQILFNKLNVDGMLYFSDHGEEVNKYFRHGDDFFMANYKKEESIRDITRIPVYLRTSAKFRENNPQIIKNWMNNNNGYFTNDMIYDTMLGIMNIKCQRYDSKQDFSSANYDGCIRRMRTLQGKIKLEDCK